MKYPVQLSCTIVPWFIGRLMLAMTPDQGTVLHPGKMELELGNGFLREVHQDSGTRVFVSAK